MLRLYSRAGLGWCTQDQDLCVFSASGIYTAPFHHRPHGPFPRILIYAQQ